MSILDFFHVGSKGAVFFVEESLRPHTILIHLGVALASAAVFFITSRAVMSYKSGSFFISDKVWLVCSVGVLFSIVFLTF